MRRQPHRRFLCSFQICSFIVAIKNQPPVILFLFYHSLLTFYRLFFRGSEMIKHPDCHNTIDFLINMKRHSIYYDGMPFAMYQYFIFFCTKQGKRKLKINYNSALLLNNATIFPDSIRWLFIILHFGWLYSLTTA